MTWVQTYTGVAWDLANPRAENVRLEDLAHSLSLLCRFTGHIREFFSVAQHSLLVCDRVMAKYPGRPSLALAALLHDAEEAYLGDWSAPLKQLLRSMTPKSIVLVGPPYGDMPTLPGPWEYIRPVVTRHRQAIAEWSELQTLAWLDHGAIKEADLESLATERRDLLGSLDDPNRMWRELPEPWDAEIEPWSPAASEAAFIERYNHLRAEVDKLATAGRMVGG